MSDKKWREEPITVKVPRLAHEVFNIIQKRYGKKRMGDAVMAFLEDTEPDLVKLAEEALAIRERLETIYGEAGTVQSDEETD